MQVRYNPTYPSQAVIGGESSFVPVFLSGLGLFFLLIFGGLGRLVMRMDGGKVAVPGLGSVPESEKGDRPSDPDARFSDDAVEPTSPAPQPPDPNGEWPTLGDDRSTDQTGPDLH